MKIKNEALLQWFREQPCEWCAASPPSEPHHLMGRGMGGGNRIDMRFNLVSLCRKCHTVFQGKAAGFAHLCACAVSREVYRLRRLDKNSKINPEDCLT